MPRTYARSWSGGRPPQDNRGTVETNQTKPRHGRGVMPCATGEITKGLPVEILPDWPLRLICLSGRSLASAHRAVLDIAMGPWPRSAMPAQPLARHMCPFLPACLQSTLGLAYSQKGGTKLPAPGSLMCSETHPPWVRVVTNSDRRVHVTHQQTPAVH